jgi:hypothetical protein
VSDVNTTLFVCQDLENTQKKGVISEVSCLEMTIWHFQ